LRTRTLTRAHATHRAQQFDLSSVVLFSNRAAALTKLGRFEAALADADAALALRPDWAKAHFRRGAALFGARRFADAAAAYEAGLALEPDNASLAQGRDLALATLRQAEAAAAPDRRACVCALCVCCARCVCTHARQLTHNTSQCCTQLAAGARACAAGGCAAARAAAGARALGLPRRRQNDAAAPRAGQRGGPARGRGGERHG
jgi:tetratricopeptide (TPR) repeat protein